jgi:hypothetical protein
MKTREGLSEDAVTVIGLAGTAVAFATSNDEEVERWFRALGRYGEAGILLQALGVAEESAEETTQGRSPSEHQAPDGRSRPADVEARVATVLTCAAEFAAQREAPAIGTVELLLAVMRVYGPDFDRALELRGSDRVELLERLESGVPAPPETRWRC